MAYRGDSMNEHIQEFINQSQKIVGYTDGGYTEIKALDQEKFAELIIKKCVEICYTTTDKSYLNGVAAGTKIMQHFGVKK